MELPKGLMDKVKQVAGEMGEAARKGATQVQTKVEQTQLRRRADDAAKRLGYLVYRERTGGEPGTETIEALVAEIKDAEDRLGSAASAAAPSVEGPDVPPPATPQAPEEATGE